MALDLANTVVFREDPERSLDRFDDPVELPRFAEAAAIFRIGEWGKVQFHPPLSQKGIEALIGIREVINSLFRSTTREGSLQSGDLSTFLRLGSDFVCNEPEGRDLRLPNLSEKKRELSLGAAAFLSAMRLLDPARLERIKICPNCHWLYFDESRNRSRRWCDMNVCGNRAKARRHYNRNVKQAGNNHV
ncbi:putative RNA-binding Zn ribbon-like protein [Phyllobacterium bourgognense]|uniref:Putative RNA-binding Zn ribbon-like protein n=1 Tax=Phyllobacterium bourgognense TaxID=314236 RepID=A0A368YBK9_9HYPH|nr:CGNR zinc finger domain-containing protein [Phyllobacterium bourgognense]RCW77650.1 putative RNA-binding Zn ribbon-like protein [Phyllobacterium bourgognense]